MEKKVHVLTEVHNDGFGNQVYVKVFDTLEKAQEQMVKEYEHTKNDNEDIVGDFCLDLDCWIASIHTRENDWEWEIHYEEVA